jgi:energy-coupling factor transport system substrate-specific component
VKSRSDVRRIDGRSLIYIAISAVLYAVLSWAANAIDIPGFPSLRPGIVIPIVSGALFGPIAGFVVGAAGRGAGDLLTFGFFWNWDLGSGLVGLIAGLTPLIGTAAERRWRRVITATLLGAVGIVLGMGFAALTDIWVANLGGDLAISSEWLPVAEWDLVLGVPLTAIVMIALERWPRDRSPVVRS